MSYKKLTKQYLIDHNEVIPAIMDPIFKRIMKNHLEYLATILSCSTDIVYDDIINHGLFLDSAMITESNDDHQNTFDLFLQVNNYYFDLEANYSYSKALEFRDNSHFSALHNYVYSKKENKDNLNLKVSQVNFDCYKKVITQEVPITLQLRDEKNLIVEDNLSKINLNIEISYDLYYNGEEKEDKLYRYLSILKVKDVDELKKISKGDEILEKVAKDIIDYSRDDRVIDEYRQAIDDANLIFNSKLEGKEEGYAQGKMDGKIEGEKQKQLEIARNLKQMGLSTEQIVQATGLSKAEIEKLKD